LVSVYDEPNIVYEWRDGKIVKKLDQSALGRLFGIRFLGGGWAAGLLTTACIMGCAIALTAGIRGYRRRHPA
jgi:hypothetical protein